MHENLETPENDPINTDETHMLSESILGYLRPTLEELLKLLFRRKSLEVLVDESIDDPGDGALQTLGELDDEIEEVQNRLISDYENVSQNQSVSKNNAREDGEKWGLDADGNPIEPYFDLPGF